MHFIFLTRCYRTTNIDTIKKNIFALFASQSKHTYQQELIVDMTHGQNKDDFIAFADEHTHITLVYTKDDNDKYMYKVIDKVVETLDIENAFTYMLDDDNILKSNFLEVLDDYHDEDAIVFKFENNLKMGTPAAIIMGCVGYIDCGSFIVRLPIMKQFKIGNEESSWEADGRFMQKLLDSGCRVRFLDKKLAYYNALPKP